MIDCWNGYSVRKKYFRPWWRPSIRYQHSIQKLQHSLVTVDTAQLFSWGLGEFYFPSFITEAKIIFKPSRLFEVKQTTFLFFKLPSWYKIVQGFDPLIIAIEISSMIIQILYRYPNTIRMTVAFLSPTVFWSNWM